MKTDGRTDGRTDGPTDLPTDRRDKANPVYPPHCGGGINRQISIHISGIRLNGLHLGKKLGKMASETFTIVLT